MIRKAENSDATQIAKMIRAMCSEIENMGGHKVSRDEALWQNLPDKVYEWLKDHDQNQYFNRMTGIFNCSLLYSNICNLLYSSVLYSN